MSILISGSNANWWGPNCPYFPVVGLSLIAEWTSMAGFDGLELHPVQYAMAGGMKDVLPLTTSLHQGFRSENSLIEAWNHPVSRVQGIAAYVLLPRDTDTLAMMSMIQAELPEPVPKVVFVEATPAEWIRAQSGPVLVQPEPKAIQALGVTTNDPQELCEAAAERGLGICLDTFHARRGGHSILTLPWQRSFEVYLPYTKEIHFSLGRYDMGNCGIETMQELRDLLEGTAKTDARRMLFWLRDHGWSGPIVLEIPAKAIGISINSPAFTKPRKIIDAHRRVVDTMRSILGI